MGNDGWPDAAKVMQDLSLAGMDDVVEAALLWWQAYARAYKPTPRDRSAVEVLMEYQAKRREEKGDSAQITMLLPPERSPNPAERVRVTTDRSDPALTRGIDEERVEQADVYLVLSASERAKGFVRPLRYAYVHETCGSVTTMGQDIAETYARNPRFYGGTFCVKCGMHRPVGEHGEFVWDDGSGQKVGT